MEVPCRKCPRCLRARAALWRARAKSEVELASRTWFCTWTLSPDARYRTLSQARAALSAQSLDYDVIEPAEQFRYWLREIGKEFTLGLKRLRKNTGATVRYCIIAECHKDGAPHFHGLVHEVDKLRPVTHKALDRDLWRLGFTRYKLADAGTVGYVTKYLTKSSLARVRASGGYGNGLSLSETNVKRDPSTFSPAADAARGKLFSERKRDGDIPF